jgi:DNA-binding NarL/FixJ family response regulator
VAAGRSNAEIAAHLGVCASTVRKHLENAYRKLGVTNRTAAVARLQGRDRGCEDLRERLERFA